MYRFVFTFLCGVIYNMSDGTSWTSLRTKKRKCSGFRWMIRERNEPMWSVDWLDKHFSIDLTMKKFRFPPFRSSKSCCSLCAAGQQMAASHQGFVWLLTPERCREGGRECVRLFRGRRTAWQQQRTSFKPVSCDFPTQRKAIVAQKKS